MRRRRNQESWLSGVLIVLYFWLYFIPIACPLMGATSPIWVPGLVAWKPGTSPAWRFRDVCETFYAGPLLLVMWIEAICRHFIVNRYKLYRNERTFRRLEPLPLPRKRPRRLSEGWMITQTTPLLTKLPLEIRQIIYEDVIRCGSEHRHILELAGSSATRKPRKPRTSQKKRVWGAGCQETLTSQSEFDAPRVFTVTPCNPTAQGAEVEIYRENRDGGPISLAKTCRQIYLEIIDMYYERQPFCFRRLERPPYFIHGTLPHRLSKIRQIHLHFCHRITLLSSSCRPTPKHRRECPVCSFCYWLDLIEAFMTGLRTVETTVAIADQHPVNLPTMKSAWVRRLLSLQRQTNANITIRVVARDSNVLDFEPCQPIRDFESQLRTELARAKESNDAIIDVVEK